ncbi:hypothetical protein GCM10023198_23880 [Promicromonospora umidemergens]|uniref:Uncharacterized protein n=1 Tax=Promicromonospora umidemergens TaxID=629679 RepID=A0ABP8X6P6_9MICO
MALAVSSDYPEAVDLVTRLYDQLGLDTVDHSPLSESWRNAPGSPRGSAPDGRAARNSSST